MKGVGLNNALYALRKSRWDRNAAINDLKETKQKSIEREIKRADAEQRGREDFLRQRHGSGASPRSERAGGAAGAERAGEVQQMTPVDFLRQRRAAFQSERAGGAAGSPPTPD